MVETILKEFQRDGSLSFLLYKGTHETAKTVHFHFGLAPSSLSQRGKIRKEWEPVKRQLAQWVNEGTLKKGVNRYNGDGFHLEHHPLESGLTLVVPIETAIKIAFLENLIRKKDLQQVSPTKPKQED